MIELAIDAGVAVVTLNRPEKKNALDANMQTQLAQVFEKIQDDPAARAVVLCGGRDFSAGADIGQMGGGGVAGSMGRMRLVHRMMRNVAGTGKPVIAAVRGVCVGVGWSLALASDYVVAADDARFQFAFRHIGLGPDGGAAFLLARHVGLMRAKELIYSGRFVSGIEAKSLGLALESLADAEVMPRAMEMARAVASAPTLALGVAKRQFDAASAQTFEQALALEISTQPLMVRTEDFAEGVASFKEKRKPAFRGN